MFRCNAVQDAIVDSLSISKLKCHVLLSRYIDYEKKSVPSSLSWRAFDLIISRRFMSHASVPIRKSDRNLNARGKRNTVAAI